MKKFIFRVAFMFATVWYAKRIFTPEFYVIGWNESKPFLKWRVCGVQIDLTISNAIICAEDNVSYMEPEA